MIAAVFDLDRTLLPGTTAERLLLRQLFRERVLGIKAVVHTARFLLSSVNLVDSFKRVKADRPYLAGLHEARLQLEGGKCVRESILPRLSRRGVDRVEEHRDSGHVTVLLSGSLPWVVEPIAVELGFDEVICSRLRMIENRVAGGLCGLHPYGEAKARLIRDQARELALNLSMSYCYADHHSDIPMLELFGHPVCVNSSGTLLRVAHSRCWTVEVFD